MRNHSRLAWFLCACLCALLLTLLLSALVEGPAAPAPTTAVSRTVEAIFLPAGTPAAEIPSVERGLGAAFALLAFQLLNALLLPDRMAGIDANGRVLRKRRYVLSFYPLFRQELACG